MISRGEHTATPSASSTAVAVAAQDYTARGWSVVPAAWPIRDGAEVRCSCRRSSCASPGKHPGIPWQAYQRSAAAVEQVRSWWARWPQANVSVVTGAVSGLIVLDIDPAHGGDESLADLEREHGPLPDTVRALTGGGGTHYWLRHPGDGDVPSRGAILPGIDIRADGGQVIAPPSLHASGQRYEWEAGAGPDDVAMAPAPAWLVALARGGAGTLERQRFDLDAALQTPIPEGERNARLTQITGALMRMHRDEPWRVAEMVHACNARLCQPPLPPDEVDAILRSIYRRDRIAAEAETLIPAESPPPDANALGQLSPESRASLLANLWHQLGLSIEVTRLVGWEDPDGVQWGLVLADGREVPLGDNLFAMTAIRHAIGNRLGEVLHPVRQGDWDRVAQRLLALAERVEVLPSGTDQLAAWITMWMASVEPVDADAVGRDAALEALRRGAPVLATTDNVRHLWLSLGRLAVWLDIVQGIRVTPRRLATWARQDDWEQATWHAGRTGWRVWRRRWPR